VTVRPNQLASVWWPTSIALRRGTCSVIGCVASPSSPSALSGLPAFSSHHRQRESISTTPPGTGHADQARRALRWKMKAMSSRHVSTTGGWGFSAIFRFRRMSVGRDGIHRVLHQTALSKPSTSPRPKKTPTITWPSSPAARVDRAGRHYKDCKQAQRLKATDGNTNGAYARSVNASPQSRGHGSLIPMILAWRPERIGGEQARWNNPRGDPFVGRFRSDRREPRSEAGNPRGFFGFYCTLTHGGGHKRGSTLFVVHSSRRRRAAQKRRSVTTMDTRSRPA